MLHLHYIFFFFFFNDTATTEIYTLSLHDALPIFCHVERMCQSGSDRDISNYFADFFGDRKSTRLNSSHLVISYAVFCLKKKKINPLYTIHVTIRNIECNNIYSTGTSSATKQLKTD